MANPRNESVPQPTPTPEPGVFVKEDISKHENRVNLALLNTLMVPAFRHWLLGRLGFPPDCVIYPPQNIGSSRPDLVVVRNGVVKGWIEIELGGEDAGQLGTYREQFLEPVKCIVGLRDAASDVGMSLEELADTARDCMDEVFDRQQRNIVQIFVDLVSQSPTSSASVDYVTPGKWIEEEPFVRALCDRLESVIIGKPPVTQSKLQFTTITQRGWTLRVFARNTTYGSISILWKQAVPGRILRVPSVEQLRKYLSAAAVDDYRQFFKERFELDIAQISGQQSLAVIEAQLLTHLDAYAVVAEPLANAA
jgi:hypothetical protein